MKKLVKVEANVASKIGRNTRAWIYQSLPLLAAEVRIVPRCAAGGAAHALVLMRLKFFENDT